MKGHFDDKRGMGDKMAEFASTAQKSWTYHYYWSE